LLFVSVTVIVFEPDAPHVPVIWYVVVGPAGVKSATGLHVHAYVLPVLFCVAYVTVCPTHGVVLPVTAGVGSGLTTSVAVCVITVVHAGVVELIARTL
jgi:hypothetical protein